MTLFLFNPFGNGWLLIQHKTPLRACVRFAKRCFVRDEGLIGRFGGVQEVNEFQLRVVLFGRQVCEWTGRPQPEYAQTGQDKQSSQHQAKRHTFPQLFPRRCFLVCGAFQPAAQQGGHTDYQEQSKHRRHPPPPLIGRVIPSIAPTPSGKPNTPK